MGFVTDLFSRVLDDGLMVFAPDAPVSGSAVYVSFRVSTNHAAAMRVALTWTGGSASLRVTGSRLIEVYDDAAPTTKVTAQMGASDTWVHVRFAQGGTHIRTASVNETVSVSLPSTSGGVREVYLAAQPGARVSNLIVSGAYHVNERLAWSQRTRFYPSSSIPAGLSDMPRQHDVDSLKLLSDITSAACLGFWRDAQGFIQVTAPDYLPATPVRTTLTSDYLLSWGWSRALDAIRRRVVLRRSVPMSGSRLVPTIQLWQSSGEVLARGHERIDVVQTPADEDWVPCTWPHRIGDPTASTVWGDPDKGQGTIVGGWAQDVSNWASDKLVTTLTSSPSAGLYVFTSTTVVANMALGESIVLATAPVDNGVTTLPTRYRDADLPILRGWATCTWIDGETVSADVGPSSAPDLVHDTGPWVQLGAQALANYLASRVVPTGNDHGLVTMESLPIRPDWRLEPGDVVEIVDAAASEVALTCLVTGITASQTAGAQSMSLDVQVLSGASLIVTYGEVDNANGARTYGQDDTLIGAATYGQDNTNPLIPRS